MKMNNAMKLVLTCFVGLFMSLLLVQCGGSEKLENAADELEDKVDQTMEDAEEAMEEIESEVDPMTRSAMEKMNSLSAELGIEEGSWGFEVLEYVESGEGDMSFTLDKVPYEGDEISAEGTKQLDDLAALLKQYPDVNIIVKGHSRSGDNAVEKTANKASSKARALWVQQKLASRGVDGKQMQAKGIGGEEPLEGVDPKEDSQRRITIAFSK